MKITGSLKQILKDSKAVEAIFQERAPPRSRTYKYLEDSDCETILDQASESSSDADSNNQSEIDEKNNEAEMVDFSIKSIGQSWPGFDNSQYANYLQLWQNYNQAAFHSFMSMSIVYQQSMNSLYI